MKAITIGSFQPFTPGHLRLVEKMRELVGDDWSVCTFRKSKSSQRMVGNKSFSDDSISQIIEMMTGKSPQVYDNLGHLMDSLSSSTIIVLGADSTLDLSRWGVAVVRIPRDDVSATRVRQCLVRNDRPGLLRIGYTEFQVDKLISLLNRGEKEGHVRTGIKHLWDGRDKLDYCISNQTLVKLFDRDELDLGDLKVTEKIDGYSFSIGKDSDGLYATSARSGKVRGGFSRLLKPGSSIGLINAYRRMDSCLGRLFQEKWVQALTAGAAIQFELYNPDSNILYERIKDGDLWLIKSNVEVPKSDYIHSNIISDFTNPVLDLRLFRAHVHLPDARQQLHEELLKRCGIGLDDEREGIVIEWPDGELLKCVTRTYLTRQFGRKDDGVTPGVTPVRRTKGPIGHKKIIKSSLKGL